ncbi:MAG: hypothetical protein ACOCPM_07270 [Bacteroidales bacterium]
MTYWARVLKVFIVLSAISLLLVLIFYSGIYQLEIDTQTIISIIAIVFILALTIPVASDGYKRKSIPLSSVHPDWQNIIKQNTAHTHKLFNKAQGLFILVRKEAPFLKWFFLGRRNIYIIVKEDKLLFYGPGEIIDKLLQQIFS